MLTNDDTFCPDWASSPGETIADILKERDLSIRDFSRLIGLPPQEVTDLLEGKKAITIALARRLSKVLGASVEFWMSRDYQYRQDVSRLRAADKDWLREIPLGEMIRFGWLKSPPHPSDEVAACLRFFGLPSIAAWQRTYASLEQMAAYRTSPTFDSRPGAVAAWLRQGELDAEQISCQPWDSSRFRHTLSSIRSLTRRADPKKFIPELQERCAASGVAIAIVRAPSGCRASGAVRFLSPDKAVLQLSFRFLTDDQFWFTFFHEAGHLLLHAESLFFAHALRGEGSWILEGLGVVSAQEESEANAFAANALVPPEFQDAMLHLPLDGREVIRFAVRIGVSPGVVVGQLQHYGKIGYNQLSSLKRRYRWED